MKIEVTGRKELISSAEVTLDPYARTLHLLITTHDQGMAHQLEGATQRTHRLVVVSAPSVAELGAEVVFLPENEEERELLFGTAYGHTENNQISYLIVPLKQKPRTYTLARLTA